MSIKFTEHPVSKEEMKLLMECIKKNEECKAYIKTLEEKNNIMYYTLAKIVDAEEMGYGTQRTYGAMAQAALDKLDKKT